MSKRIDALEKQIEQQQRDLTFLARFLDPQARNTVSEHERFAEIMNRYPRYRFEETDAA